MGVIRSISRGVALTGAVVAGGALAITASSVLATPQPLESALEGEGRIFRFREGDVFYTARGPADAPAVLFLHSVHLGASSFEWRKNFHALSQSFRVYAPDLLGFGLSDRPAIDYSADLYVHLISDFAREIIARPAIVIARDQSAAFAVRAAHLDSQLFTRLVFISPTGIISAAAEDRDWAARSSSALQRLLRRFGDTTVGQVPYAFLTTKPALSWLIARQSYANPEYAAPEVVQHLYATTHQFGARFAPLAFMSGKLDIDVATDFATLDQPILLVWGELDAINDPIYAEALCKLNPHTRLELIPQAGNAAQEEQVTEVNELLHAWVLAPPELVDPMLRGHTIASAPPVPAAEAPPPAPEITTAPVLPPTPETTAAPLTTPLPEPPTPAEPAATAGPTVETPAPAEPVAEVATPEMPVPAQPAAEVATPETPAPQTEPPASAQAEAAEKPAEQAPEPAPPASSKAKTPRRPARKSTGIKPGASGQARQGKAAPQTGQRDTARQARPNADDKPEPPRPSGGPRKKT
ncbi:MAG TPA: alpha/beta fold hydrolase [Ktedonobacterales bacterium]|nr:alpha/beta fold hydrolase [Ktedonobacterales bacterium]